MGGGVGEIGGGEEIRPRPVIWWPVGSGRLGRIKGLGGVVMGNFLISYGGGVRGVGGEGGGTEGCKDGGHRGQEGSYGSGRKGWEREGFTGSGAVFEDFSGGSQADFGICVEREVSKGCDGEGGDGKEATVSVGARRGGIKGGKERGLRGCGTDRGVRDETGHKGGRDRGGGFVVGIFHRERIT